MGAECAFNATDARDGGRKKERGVYGPVFFEAQTTILLAEKPFPGIGVTSFFSLFFFTCLHPSLFHSFGGFFFLLFLLSA